MVSQTVMKKITGILIVGLWLAVNAYPAVSAPAEIQQRDKCPVCGMFVAKYTDFLAQIRFTDGTYVVFDGAKDMFKFYLDPDKYKPGSKVADMREIYVTDYYNLSLIDAKNAFFVIGSDIYGPMGNELIPFALQADAEEFMNDHSGKRILKFVEVADQTIGELDN